MNPTSRKGFTLVELLTTLTILSVVSAIGIGAFFRVTEYWNRSSIIGTLNHQAALALDSLRTDTGTVISSRVAEKMFSGTHGEYAGDKRFWQIRFEEDRLTLPVQTWDPIGNQPGPVMRVTYFIDRSGPTARLIRQASLPTDNKTGNRVVIADCIVGLRVAYWNGKEWRPEWAEAGLPQAIRVSLSLLDPRTPDQHLAREAVFNLNVR